MIQLHIILLFIQSLNSFIRSLDPYKFTLPKKCTFEDNQNNSIFSWSTFHYFLKLGEISLTVFLSKLRFSKEKRNVLLVKMFSFSLDNISSIFKLSIFAPIYSSFWLFNVSLYFLYVLREHSMYKISPK